MASLLPSSGLSASARSRGIQTAARFLAEKQRDRQRLIGEVIGRRKIHGAPRGGQRAIERARTGVETVAVLVGVDP